MTTTDGGTFFYLPTGHVYPEVRAEFFPGLRTTKQNINTVFHNLRK